MEMPPRGRKKEKTFGGNQVKHSETKNSEGLFQIPFLKKQKF